MIWHEAIRKKLNFVFGDSIGQHSLKRFVVSLFLETFHSPIRSIEHVVNATCFIGSFGASHPR